MLTSLTEAWISIALMDWTCYETNVRLLLLFENQLIYDYIREQIVSHPFYHWNIKRHPDLIGVYRITLLFIFYFFLFYIEVYRITLLWFRVKDFLLQVLSLYPLTLKALKLPTSVFSIASAMLALRAFPILNSFFSISQPHWFTCL